MQKCNHKMAVRLYAGELKIDHISSSGADYHLLNLPYCLAFMINEYLEWFETQIE